MAGEDLGRVGAGPVTPEPTEFRRLMDLSPVAVVLLDAGGTIETANMAMARLVGQRDRMALAGRPLVDLVVREDRATITAQLTRVLFAPGRTAGFDASLVHAAGRIVPCELRLGHLGDDQSGLMVVIHDLTTRVQREEEHTHLTEQLARAQRLDTVGQLASGLAHDLNNLLVVMMSNLGLATESLAELDDVVGKDRLDPVRTDLQEIQHAVDRAAHLTGKLLEFARREQGQEETADVAEVIDAVEHLVWRSLGDGIAFEVDVADDLPLAAVDPAHLERAVLNLLINARDAVDGKGAIRLFARPSRLPAGRGSPVPAGPAVRIEVIDDGCGMTDEVRARAFEPMFTTKIRSGGSGLGLSSVLAFVDSVGGSVRVASQPGVGTSISLAIPAADRSGEDVPVGVDVPVAGARVLLVDPGERTRRTIAAMLRSAGYRVVPAASAQEAARLVDAQTVDLVLTELSLPTGARLRDWLPPREQQLPTVYLSNVDAPPELEGVPVLVKPFSSMRLLRTVQQRLSGS